MEAVALGLRAHSGWAVLVAVAGPPAAARAVERRQIVLADPAIRGSRQPYHAAEPLPFEKARELIARCTTSSRRLARQALGAAVADLRARRHEVASCGLLLASGRPTGSLERTLASHALIHAAEGELYRDVLRRAAEHCGLPLVGVRESEVKGRATAALRLAEAELGRRIQEMGRPLGPPWRQDEKLAALVGWLLLAEPPRR